MRAVVFTAVLSAALGAGAAWISIDRGWWPHPAVLSGAGAIDDVPQMSLAEAESHRAARFEQIRTIEDVLALPGEFARTEAFYALAGRSDSAAVQDLIFQADGIGNASERATTLAILFSRLTELDPASALALSTSEYFASEPAIESAVWTTWGRLDLDGALRHARALDGDARKKLAAEALLAAHGFWGNATTERIAATLDITPDSNTRAHHLYQLADRRPAEAIAYINSMGSMGNTLQQHELARLLGRHLGKLGLQASDYATVFDDEALREEYLNSVVREAAKDDPESVLDTLLSGDSPGNHRSRLHYAMTALAEQDIDRAMSYLERARNRRDHEILSNVVAARLARKDPQRALAWAREHDRSPHGNTYNTVLMSIAADHPEVALQEARSITNPMRKQHAYMMIGMTLGRRDPEKAIALIEQVPGAQERRNMAEMITNSWVQQDPDAALSWLLKSDVADDAVMMKAAQTLAQADLDSAMRWLPRVDERHQSMWRSTIAAHLGAQESPATAESFIARFQHSPDYPQLVASVALGIARTDLDAAFRMSERISSAADRESLTVQLINHEAHANPQKAAERLATIADPAQRAQAAGQVAGAWARQDPAAAEYWVRNLKSGTERDQAIMHLTWGWDDLTPSRRALIDGVADPKVRQQAMTNLIYRIARSDIRRAESLMNEMDLTEGERQQVERNLRSMRNPAPHM